MSKILFTKSAAPTSPGANKTAIFFDTDDLRFEAKDENGVISYLADNGHKGLNIIHNGGMRVQQRQVPASTAIAGVSTTTRAGQVADRWAVTTTDVGATLSWQQVDAAGTQESNLSARYYGSIIVATTGRKVMLSQVILSSDMEHLRGRKVRVSIKANQKVGSGQIYNLGLLQLQNAGVVDVMPAFLTGAWSAVSGTDPSWGTNLAAIAPDASPTGEGGTISGNWLQCTSVATTWTKYSAVFSIPTNAKNLVFVFFQNTTGGTTDNISISECMITEGSELVDYTELPLGYEIAVCQQFFSKSFPYAILPADGTSVANAGYGPSGPVLIAGSGTALSVQLPIQFPIPMWKVPAITYYAPVSGTGTIYRHTGGTPAAQGATATVASTLTEIGCTVQCAAEATINAAVGNWCSVHWKAEADFIL